MYGLLNAALKEFLVQRYGTATWQDVASGLASGNVTFNKMDPYPDDLTYGMLARANEVTGATSDSLLDAFGEFWVGYTDRQGYGQLFEIAGDSLRDFLLSLNTLHARVGRSFPKLRPPAFRFDTLEASGLCMHYESTRPGLCPIIPGILRGLSLRFQTPLTVRESRCSRQGAEHCEFELQFPSAGAS